jgi:hypothetical protein
VRQRRSFFVLRMRDQPGIITKMLAAGADGLASHCGPHAQSGTAAVSKRKRARLEFSAPFFSIRVRALLGQPAQYRCGLYLEPVQYGCGLYLQPAQ